MFKTASVRDWTHNHLVKQKVDEFSTKSLPLSYWGIIQRKTAYYWKIEIWMFFISILFMQVQEGKSKQKWWFFHKPLAEF